MKLILLLAALLPFSPAFAAEPEHPCEDIMAACEAAHFAKGLKGAGLVEGVHRTIGRAQAAAEDRDEAVTEGRPGGDRRVSGQARNLYWQVTGRKNMISVLSPI